MTSSENPQTGVISIQLPRLFPHSTYQPLSESSNSADPLSQTNISDTIPPNTNSAVQTDLVRPSAVNVNRRRSAEAQFKESFDRFYQKYRSNQAFTLMFFSILTLGYSLEAEVSVYLFFLCDVVYMVSLVRACCCGKSTVIDSFRAMYKISECLVAHLIILGSDYGSIPGLIVFLITSYLFKAVAAYFSNLSDLVKLADQVNKKIFEIRICIFTQGILIIASLCFYIPFLLLFMPFYIIILVIVLFTANFIKSVYFTYDDSRFTRTMNENKAGVIWILGNLFGLIGVLILQAYFLLIDEIKGVFNTWVFVAVLLWCLISLMYNGLCYNEVFKVCETLAILLETNGNMPTNEEIKYVTRISNTYFRPATEQEINNFNNETASENDLEAGVENNTEGKAKCLVCCRKSANAVFMRCGHGGVCFSCGKKINNSQKECHLCRQRIKAIFKMNIKKDNKHNVYEIVQTISNIKKGLCWDNINF